MKKQEVMAIYSTSCDGISAEHEALMRPTKHNITDFERSITRNHSDEWTIGQGFLKKIYQKKFVTMEQSQTAFVES